MAGPGLSLGKSCEPCRTAGCGPGGVGHGGTGPAEFRRAAAAAAGRRTVDPGGAGRSGAPEPAGGQRPGARRQPHRAQGHRRVAGRCAGPGRSGPGVVRRGGPGQGPGEDVLAARNGSAPGTGWNVTRPVRGCPYRGLLPFGESDADVFYGRERLAAELAAKLAARAAGGGLVVVTGASGRGSPRCCGPGCCQSWPGASSYRDRTGGPVS